MGTRSIAVLRDGKTEIAVLYRQYDGYPSVAGADIKEALGGKVVVNGYSSEDQVNGGGCMAVQLISYLKAKRDNKPNVPGMFYLYPAGTRNCGEEYTYDLTCPTEPEGSMFSHPKWEGRISLKLTGYRDRVLYDGPLDDFDPGACEPDAGDDE